MVFTKLLYFLVIFPCVVRINGESLFFSTERPTLTHVNPKYLSFCNFTTTRYGRRNPMYYVNINLETLFTMDNNYIVTFTFYEYLNSQYQRSFLELTLKWCNLIYKDKFFGPAMKKSLPDSCPHKPGSYHFLNMTASMSGMPLLLRALLKGRLQATMTTRAETVVSGHIDFEVKRRNKP